MDKRKLGGKESISSLDKKLWRIFSKFIRLRDLNPDGTFTCISCGQTKSKDQMQAGHYYSRKKIHLAVKFDEKNVNGQCIYCNHFNAEDSKHGYKEGLIKKYGEDVITYLDIKKNNKCKWDRFTYHVLIREYQDKLKELEEKKETVNAQ